MASPPSKVQPRTRSQVQLLTPSTAAVANRTMLPMAHTCGPSMHLRVSVILSLSLELGSSASLRFHCSGLPLSNRRAMCKIGRLAAGRQTGRPQVRVSRRTSHAVRSSHLQARTPAASMPSKHVSPSSHCHPLKGPWVGPKHAELRCSTPCAPHPANGAESAAGLCALWVGRGT